MAPVAGTGDTGLTDIILHEGVGGSWSAPVTFLPSASAWMTQKALYFIILVIFILWFM